MSRRSAGIVAVMVLGLLGATHTASASERTLSAQQDPAVPSQFTLDFGEFGGPRVAQISNTQYTLAIDENAPAGESAHFTSYHQNVDELFLPNPQGGEDLSTGPITISIEESFGGTYNAETGEVTTFDLYRIEFEGDLSNLGIESPVFLEGASTGIVTFTAPKQGEITLDWDGTHTIGELTFSYVCETNTTFASVPTFTSVIVTIFPGLSWLFP